MTLRINRAKSWLYVVINPLISVLEEQVSGEVFHPHMFSRRVKYLVSDDGFLLCFRDLVRNNKAVAELVDAYDGASLDDRVKESLKLRDALEELGAQLIDEFDIPAAPFSSWNGR